MLPVDHLGVGAHGVVEIREALFGQHAVDVGPQGDLLVAELGILAAGIGTGLDDLVLLVVDLERIGGGIAAIAHQVGDGQKGADQDFLVILAAVGGGIIVGDHPQGRLAEPFPLQIVEMVADFAELQLGVVGLAQGEVDHGPLEFQHVAVVGHGLQSLVDGHGGGFGMAQVEILPHLPQIVGVRGAAAQRQRRQQQSEF